MPEPADKPDPTNPVRYKSEAFRALIKEKTGVDFDYSMFALLHLDAVFNQMVASNLQNLQKPEFEKHRNDLILQLGFFIGECLRETFSGQWDKDPNLGICLKRIGNQEITAFPMSTASDCVAGEKGKSSPSVRPFALRCSRGFARSIRAEQSNKRRGGCPIL